LIAQAQTGATWQARAHAVSGLATFHDPEALRVTLALLNDPSVEVATEAISTLEAYGTPAVRAELLRVLDDQGRCFHPLTRAAALLALARSDDANEQARVRDAVRDVAAEVSLAAITAIGTRRLPADLSALERVVEDASGFFVPDVRAAAQRALLGTEPPVVIGSRH
jgi:HEAT repeat protein